jgi:hypothetical protein
MNNQHWFNRHRFASHLRIAGAVTLLSAAAAMAFVAVNPSGNLLSGKSKAKVENKFAAKSARANALTSRFRTLLGNPNEKDGEAGPMNDAAQAMYDDQAYPAQYILPAQQQNALNAANAIKRLPGGKQSNWQEVGPSGVPADALVASESTGASSGTIFSGRATAIAVAPNCTANKGCAIFIGAAGGGVWQANNALDPQPNWAPSSNGIPSNAIGSLAFDPKDPNSKTH